MPLTRNLYELDEVVSALQICLRKGWGRAIFWLWELVVSKEEKLAAETLHTAWLHLGGGLFWPQLSSITDEQWIERCLLTQAAIKSSAGLTAARFIRPMQKKQRPGLTPTAKSHKTINRRATRSAEFVTSLDPAESIDSKEAAKLWIDFDSACRQGKRADAFWLLQDATTKISADAIWSLLRIASRGGPPTRLCIDSLAKVAGPHPMEQILHQAASVLLLCIPTKERFAETADIRPGFYRRDWADWNAVVGRRTARIHSIPAEALHSEVTRGRLHKQFTNIDDVRNPVYLLPEGCRFWREAISSASLTFDPATGSFSFPSDEDLENFYSRYFPDDLPDEWSLADQEKSHGRGCGPDTPPPPPSIDLGD